MTNKFETPLSVRYASKYMLNLFSLDTRFITWRKLWVALAKAEKTLGLNITQEQIDQLEANIYNLNYDVINQREKEVKHDVMAHIYGYGKLAPQAEAIIHLGATSCYVTDNADLIIYRDALLHIKTQLEKLISSLIDFANVNKDVPTLGYTHYQPAQLVTVGKRATLWIQDLMSDYQEIQHVIENIKFLGCRGTTGTEASFMKLFDDDSSKIDQMNQLIAKEFNFDQLFDVCGQTYPRKLDSLILNVLSSIGQTLHKMATDVRLLQHDYQIEEPFAENQIGSSAMAYKKNPIRCERICSLARYLISNVYNSAFTSSTQWFERTLDDSANRRIVLPESFLCADSILLIAQNVFSGLKVNKKIIEKAVLDYLPYIATENILMEAVKKGGNRQIVHGEIRRISLLAKEKNINGEEFNMIDEMKKSSIINLSDEELNNIFDPNKYIGRCVEQVTNYLEKVKSKINYTSSNSSEFII